MIKNLKNIALSKHGKAFLDKVEAISKELGTRSQWLLQLMYNESGINPQAKNSIGAVGLIQFLPSTVRDLGYEPEEVLRMSAIEQLDLVKKYYKKWSKALGIKYDDPAKLYAVTFYPEALRHWNDNKWIVGSERSLSWAQKVREQNKGFDTDNDGYITIRDLKKYYYKLFDYKPLMGLDVKVKNSKLKNWLIGSLALIVLGVLIYFLLIKK